MGLETYHLRTKGGQSRDMHVRITPVEWQWKNSVQKIKAQISSLLHHTVADSIEAPMGAMAYDTIRMG